MNVPNSYYAKRIRRAPKDGIVYLLHSSIPLPHGKQAPSQHYLGWAADGDAERRLQEHQSGTGARICAAMVGLGAKLFLVRTWDGGKAQEYRLKRRRSPRRLCPLCQGVDEQ